jgi:hypothetical protein
MLPATPTPMPTWLTRYSTSAARPRLLIVMGWLVIWLAGGGDHSR